MRYLVFIICFLPLFVHGQSSRADSVGKHSVGYTDENGLKQGFWIDYKDLYFKITNTAPTLLKLESSDFIKTYKTDKFLIQSFIQRKGNYKNNQKIGKWEFWFINRGDYYFDEGTFGPEFYITYFEDGSVLSEKMGSKIKYNSDSTKINGTIGFSIKQEWIIVNLECNYLKEHNCTWCNFIGPDGNTFEEFCSNNIEFYVEPLINGNYNNKIKNNP
jgi:hypothetical protein